MHKLNPEKIKKINLFINSDLLLKYNQSIIKTIFYMSYCFVFTNAKKKESLAKVE